MKRTTYPTEFAVFLPTPGDPGQPREAAYHISVVDVLDMEDGTPPVRIEQSARMMNMAQAIEAKLDLGSFVRDAVDSVLAADRDNAHSALETARAKAEAAAVASSEKIAEQAAEIEKLRAELKEARASSEK